MTAAHSIVFHPRYERFLRRWGLDTPEAILAFPGEILCGHPDRHVAVLRLGSRLIYRKREHVIGWRVRWKNRRAGYGWVSRSEREAQTLRQLEELGLPGPQWLAYGEDAKGCAFLLIDEVAGAQDLPNLLRSRTLTLAERRDLADRMGHTLAEFHIAGFSTPDLTAKHLLVRPGTQAVSLIDWQSTVREPISPGESARQFASLAASVPDEWAGPRDRLRVATSYWRMMRWTPPQVAEWLRVYSTTLPRSARRSSIRDQRFPHPAPRLVWLADEQVCVLPEMVDVWPQPATGEPFYHESPTLDQSTSEEWVTFPNGLRGLVVRQTTFDPLGRLMAAIRERPWRSPASVAARVLIHLQRCGIPAPRLLAFGQRLPSPVLAQSFLLCEPLRQAVPLVGRWQARSDRIPEVATVLRKLHDVDLCLTAGLGSFVVKQGTVAVESASAVRLRKRLSDAERRADLRKLAVGLDRRDRARLVRGYASSSDRGVRRTLWAWVR